MTRFFIRHWLSRRDLLARTALIAGTGAFGSVSGQQPSPKRALALIGDRYHNADYIRVALDRVFHDLGIPIDYTIAFDRLSANLLKGYGLFVCFRDGYNWPNGYLGPDAYSSYEQGLEDAEKFAKAKSQPWLTEEQAVAVRDFVRAGNGFYSLHNNSHLSLSSKIYRDVQGGAYRGHPTLRPFKVRVVNAEHPITRGINDFFVNDEQHFVQYDKDRKNILLESENVDGLSFGELGTKSVAGWAHEYGKGRVVFTAIGHTIHALWEPQYLEIQKRSVKWLLKDL